MKTAIKVFQSRNIRLLETLYMDKAEKKDLVSAIQAAARDDDADICYIYYTGHGKRRDEFREGGVIDDFGGAWVLAKANMREVLHQTIEDLMPLSGLLDAWESGLRMRPGYSTKKVSLRLLILPDCCASAEFERQLHQGKELIRRDSLGVSMHLISMTNEKNLADVVDLGLELLTHH